MFKKKNKHNKLKGAAVAMGVVGTAAGIAAVAFKDKKNQKKVREFANMAQKKGVELLKNAKINLKRTAGRNKAVKKSVVKNTKKKTEVKSISKK